MIYKGVTVQNVNLHIGGFPFKVNGLFRHKTIDINCKSKSQECVMAYPAYLKEKVKLLLSQELTLGCVVLSHSVVSDCLQPHGL